MPRTNPRQAEAALEAWRAFLLPILSQPGAPASFGKAHAALRLGAERPLPKFRSTARVYADGLSRQIRGKVTKAPYPEPDSIWEMSRTFRFAGLGWAWPPVLYYASGHLRPLVEAVATVDATRLPPPELLDLLRALPGAVQGDMRARARWTLQYAPREAFLPPEEAAGRLRLPLPDDMFLAYVIAGHFELPFELQRTTVLEYMQSWVESQIPAYARRAYR